MIEPDESALDMRATMNLVFENWRDELKAAWGPVLLGDDPDTVVRVASQTLEVFWRRSGDSDFVGSVPIENGKADTRALRSLAEQAGSRDVTLQLPAEAVLRPQLSLPLAGGSALSGALAYEIERISPVPAAELCYDHNIVGRNGTMGDFELRLVRRQSLDGPLAACRAAGLCVAAIAFDGDTRLADWRGFPIDRKARLRILLKRYRRIGMIAAALLLGGALLVAAYERQMAGLETAIEASVEAGQRAAKVEKLQYTIKQASNDLGYPAQQKRTPLMLSVLAELSQILPDGTWISEFTFDGKTIRITGSSSAAADLISLIDRSPKFRSARFEAPVVHDQAANTDRFDMSFQVRGL